MHELAIGETRDLRRRRVVPCGLGHPDFGYAESMLFSSFEFLCPPSINHWHQSCPFICKVDIWSSQLWLQLNGANG